VEEAGLEVGGGVVLVPVDDTDVAGTPVDGRPLSFAFEHATLDVKKMSRSTGERRVTMAIARLVIALPSRLCILQPDTWAVHGIPVRRATVQ
jgi:hypothetical protein